MTSPARPAWYALARGGWRDYVTLLHPPYTAWHLSYVVIGGCLAPPAAWERLEPVVAWGRLAAAVAAFALAVGIGAHALDELQGRPLRTRIPDQVLVALAAVSITGACVIGVVGAAAFRAWLVVLIPIGLFLVLAYNLELAGGRFHSDVWFGLAWGGFPVLCGYAAVAGEIGGVTVVAAVFAVLLSLAQRVLSNQVRYLRRRVLAVRGELQLADASTQPLDASRLIAPAETALRLLSLATVTLAATLVAFRI
jgi:heme O synthase-like polyprenyltransferase